MREGLMDALSRGISVTAKVSWLTHAPSSPLSDIGSQKSGKGRPVIPLHLHPHDGRTSSNTSAANSEASNFSDPTSELEGKPRWIHCTPLLGSDSRPGVWMVVIVDKGVITGASNVGVGGTPVISGREAGLDDLSSTIAGMRLDDARFYQCEAL